jgi:multiple sugar transport system permease protein
MGARRSPAWAVTVLAVAIVVTLFPVVWILLGSLQTQAAIVAGSPLPAHPQWSNYAQVVHQIPFGLYYRNSAEVAVITTLVVVATSAMAGFALAKYRFPGRGAIFGLILATMMIPNFVFYIPIYYMFRHAPLLGGNGMNGLGGSGVLGSIAALILPYAVSAWGIFLMRQSMLTLPDELFDAARMDGSSEFRLWWQIALPLSVPALVTVAVFTFITQWNNFFWPLIVATSYPNVMTLPVGLQYLQTTFDPLANEQFILAGLVVGMIPASLVFLLLQRYYISGITLGGVRE